MADAAALNDILKNLECAICLETVENPRRLLCEHSFYKKCIDGLLVFEANGSASITCPQKCAKRSKIGKDKTTSDLGVDFMMKGILDSLGDRKKSILSEQPTAGCGCEYKKEGTFFDFSDFDCKRRHSRVIKLYLIG